MDGFGSAIRLPLVLVASFLLVLFAVGGGQTPPANYSIWPQKYPLPPQIRVPEVPPPFRPFGGFHIKNPGKRGLVSDIDPHLLEPDDAYYCMNGRVNNKGYLTLRYGISETDMQSRTIYSASSFYDMNFDYELYFGADTIRDELYTAYPNLFVADTLDTTMTGMADLFMSSKSDVIMDSLVSSHTHCDSSDYDYHYPWLFQTDVFDELSFCQFQGFMIVSNGVSIPHLVTGSYSDHFCADTGASGIFAACSSQVIESPRIYSFGNEAPGQLRATPLTAGSSLDGYYRWRYIYGYMNTTLYINNIPDQHASRYDDYWSIPTPYTLVDNQCVALSLFESKPRHYSEAAADSIITHFAIARQKLGEGEWLIFDSGSFWDRGDYIYIDSGKTSALTFSESTVDGSDDNHIYPPPGAFIFDTLILFNGLCASDWGVDSTKKYVFAYSYYDPQTGIETPIGPRFGFAWRNYAGVQGDTALLSPGAGICSTRVITKGYSSEVTRYPYIRIYRSEDVALSVDDFDDVPLYGMLEVPANSLSPYFASYPVDKHTRFAGWWRLQIHVDVPSDADLIAGTQTIDWIHDADDIPLTEYGTIPTKPPYISSCEIPFVQIEVMNQRLWGIGDPEHSYYLYYSEYDQVFDWDPNDYIAIGQHEGTDIVSICAIPYGTTEHLLILKERSVWLLGGTEPEYDIQISLLPENCGPRNRHLVVRNGPVVLFVDEDNYIWKFENGQLTRISDYIQNYVDSVFINPDSCFGFALGDRIIFTDKSLANTYDYLSYNCRYGTFFLESYASDFHPRGSFLDHNGDWTIYQTDDDEGGLYREMDTASYDIPNTVVDCNDYYHPPFEYWAYIGEDMGYWSMLGNIYACLSGSLCGAGSDSVVFVLTDFEDATNTKTISLTGITATPKWYKVAFGPIIGKRFRFEIESPDSTMAVKLEEIFIEKRPIIRY